MDKLLLFQNPIPVFVQDFLGLGARWEDELQATGPKLQPGVFNFAVVDVIRDAPMNHSS